MGHTVGYGIRSGRRDAGVDAARAPARSANEGGRIHRLTFAQALYLGLRRIVFDTYTVALAATEHLPAIPKIEQAAAATLALQDLPLSLRYRVTDSATLQLAQVSGRLWVALHEARRPVGFALAEVADGQAYLSEMAVHPEHMRRGLGTRLVSAVVEWAVSQRFESVSLVTFRHLPWNAPFYGKLGFMQLAESELGQELRGFIEEEAQAGIDSGNRVGMRMNLQPQRTF